MPTINVTLYGDIAQYGSGKQLATLDLDLPQDANIGLLLERIRLPSEERGYLFVNSVLHDVPGLNASHNDPLKDGDHVGIFSISHMWPYQYRQGIHLSDTLKAALEEKGVMKNTYRE